MTVYRFIEYLDIINIMVTMMDIINTPKGKYVDRLPNNTEDKIQSIANKQYSTIFLFEYGIKEVANDKYINPMTIKIMKYKKICGGTILLNIKCFNPNTIEQIVLYINKLFTCGI